MPLVVLANLGAKTVNGASGPRLPSSYTRFSTAVHCPFTYVADLPTFQIAGGFDLPAATASVQPPVHRSTVGSGSLSVAGSQDWNILPPEVTSVPTL